jgi:hypothetical protein
VSGPEVVHRRPLTWDEVPLPPGYDRSVLDPVAKEALRLLHKARAEEVLAERAFIVARSESDPVYREKVLVLSEQDPAWWIDRFVWTYDDRVGVEEPLVLYPFQNEKIVQPHIQSRVTVTGRKRWTRVVTKSRGVGWTVVEMACAAHEFLFVNNWSTLVGAVSRDDVDDGGQEATQESLFGKIRYILSRLPRWMRERLLGPSWTRHEFNKHYLLKNPLKPRNIIAGKQLGSMFGRGHRFSRVIGDEIAHAEEMAAADTSLKQTTNRFDGASTPLGKHTFHYQLFSGSLPGVQTAYIHWSEHPELDLDWYNEQRQHMTDEQIAQELDCSFEASAGGRVLREIHLDTHFILNEHIEGGRLVGAYEPGIPLLTVIDPGIADATAITWAQWDERRCEGRVVDFVQAEERTIDWLVPFVLGQIPDRTHRGLPWPHEYNAVEEEIIQRHRLWGAPETVFGDHYGTARSLSTGLSAYDELAQYGIFVCPVRIDDDMAAIARLVLWLRYVRFARRLIEQRNGPPETCPTMGEVVTQWRFPRRKEGDYRQIMRPIHDRFCHGGDTLKMLAWVLDLPEATEQPVGSGRVTRARGSDLVGGRSRWPAYRRR